MDLLPGCHTPQAIQDILFHPLLGGKWSPIVRRVEFITCPIGILASGTHGPTWQQKGLMVVTISSSLPRLPTVIPSYAAPVLSIPQSRIFIVDFFAEGYLTICKCLSNPILLGAKCGSPNRSPSTTNDQHSLRMDLYFPVGVPEVDSTLSMRYLRHSGVPQSTIYGARAMYADPTAFLTQTTAPTAALGAWTLCKEAVFVSPTNILLTTEATADAWRAHMDNTLNEDPTSATLKIAYKRSYNGGRTWATPSFTPGRLAATRRTKGLTTENPQPHHLATDIFVRGPLGINPQHVITERIKIVNQHTGLNLPDASLHDETPSHTWRWLAATDPTAPPGRVRLQLDSMTKCFGTYMTVL